MRTTPRLSLLPVAAVLLALMACSLARTPRAPSSPSGSTQAASPLPGIPFSATPIRLVIPPGLAASASAETIDVVTDQTGAPWDVAPVHLQLTFQGYPLQASFHVPQLFVYPADEYAAANEAAARSITLLHGVLANPASAANPNALPRVPFFNAGQVLAVQAKVIHFHGGSGVRFVAHYAQDVSPINNGGLFYHFEGLSSDDQYYIVGVLPLNLPFLADDNNPDMPVPTGGVPFPAPSASPLSYTEYYRRIGQIVEAASAGQFSPSLDMLDTLAQSISIDH